MKVFLFGRDELWPHFPCMWVSVYKCVSLPKALPRLSWIVEVGEFVWLISGWNRNKLMGFGWAHVEIVWLFAFYATFTRSTNNDFVTGKTCFPTNTIVFIGLWTEGLCLGLCYCCWSTHKIVESAMQRTNTKRVSSDYRYRNTHETGFNEKVKSGQPDCMNNE